MSGPDMSLVVRCDCSDLGHLIIFDAWHWDTDAPQYSQLLAHMELESGEPWWRRLWMGARYAMTGRTTKWWWVDNVINDASAAALRDFLSEYLGQSLNAASAMSAGTAETQSGSGLQPASAARESGDAQNIAQDIGGPSQ